MHTKWFVVGNKGEADKKKKPKPKNSKNTRKKEESSEFSSDSSKSSNDSSEDDQMSCGLNVRLNKGQKSEDMNDSQYSSSDECKFNKRTNNEHNFHWIEYDDWSVDISDRQKYKSVFLLQHEELNRLMFGISNCREVI